jgi:hypothetical protein
MEDIVFVLDKTLPTVRWWMNYNCQTRPTQHRSARLPSDQRGPTQPPSDRARRCPTVPDRAPPHLATHHPTGCVKAGWSLAEFCMHRPGAGHHSNLRNELAWFHGDRIWILHCKKTQLLECSMQRSGAFSEPRHDLTWFLGDRIRVLHQAGKRKCWSLGTTLWGWVGMRKSGGSGGVKWGGVGWSGVGWSVLSKQCN